MKKKIVAALVAGAALLGAGGYFGKKHFDENYVLLNAEEVAELEIFMAMQMQRAYQIGVQECDKNI